MALRPITTSGPTITVTTQAELEAAYWELAQLGGGGTILLEPGSYGSLSFRDFNGGSEEPVIIKSSDPANPAHFAGISIRDIENVRIENVHFDSTSEGIGDGSYDLIVKDSSNIQIVNSVFMHDEGNALKDADTVVDQAIFFRESEDILFQGNLVDGYYHGIQAIEVDTLEVVGNEITNIQADGFRGGGLQNLLIDSNYFHDFYGIEYNITHPDLIQLWGSNAKTLTQNVTISNNILMTSEAASQSIFIRNEEFGKAGDPTAGHYTNINVIGNLIYNSHLHGVRVDDADGVTIDNNTILYNPDAAMIIGGVPHVYDPTIVVRNSLDVAVNNNITTTDISLPDTVTSAEGNQILDYERTTDPDYVGKHFANPFAGKFVSVEDLHVLANSPWYGVVGSSIGNDPGDISNGATAVLTASSSEDDVYEITLDASASFSSAGPLGAGYTFQWTFDDGTTATGPSVTKVYDDGGFKGVSLEVRNGNEVVAAVTRNFAVETKDVFAFDFEDGVVDVSDGNAEIIENSNLTASEDGTGYLIGEDRSLELGRATDGLFSLDSFGLTLDLTPTGGEQPGAFLHLYQTMTGLVSDEGYIVFQLTTDQGTYELISREPVFADGETHKVGIAFDGNEGRLEIFADGESVSSTEAWGTTSEPVYWNLVFGHPWNDTMDAVIDNVAMSADPAIASGVSDVASSSTPDVVSPPVVAPQPPAVQDSVVDPIADAPTVDDDPVFVSEPLADTPADSPTLFAPPTSGTPAAPSPAPADPPSAPPAADPSADDVDPPADRGEEPDAVPATDGDSFFLAELLDQILKFFGLRSDDEPPEVPQPDVIVRSEEVTVVDIVPDTGPVDEVLPDDDEDDETVFMAA